MKRQYIIFYLFYLLSFQVSKAQQTDVVDFKCAKVNLSINAKEKKVSGRVIYNFKVIQATDSIYIDAVNMTFEHVLLNSKKIDCKNSNNRLVIYHSFKKLKSYKLAFNYTAHPKKALYFMGWDTLAGNPYKNQIWTQGQGKNTSHWLPSFDDVNEKVVFNITFNFDANYSVISNGKLIKKTEFGRHTQWDYTMKKPMSSYLLALAIGKYHKKTVLSKNKIPLEFYYYPEDTLRVEPTYRFSKKIFDFFESDIGVPYPWQNYKQIPVKDFLYAGMENTSATIFSDAYVIDSISFIDRNYVNINAHELAHQWFGNLVTATSSKHHWLQEGFATFYALLAEKQLFGDDYFYMTIYQYAQQLRHQEEEGKSTSLLNPKSSSLTFYKKGALALLMLREQVGEVAFKKGIKSYLKKHRFKNVNSRNLLSEISKTSGLDLSAFAEQWLYSPTFKYNTIESYLLNKSPFIKNYMLTNCEGNVANCKQELKGSTSTYIKQKIIYQLAILQEEIPVSVFKTADYKLRQSLAQVMTDIPIAYKEAYESLLNDPSYTTIESALYNLWNNFPNDRKRYLISTKHLSGFNDKNIRVLWLSLALSTADFEPKNKELYLKELISYTSPFNNSELRERAFSYLFSLKIINQKVIENLNEATQHHNWRFKAFAKRLQKKMLMENTTNN